MQKGYVYALLAVLFLSSGLVFNKYLLQFVNPRMLSFAFFGTVFVSTTLVLLLTDSKKFFDNLIKHWKDGVVVGGLNAIAATFFFLALDLLDPSTTAFLVRFSTIFIILIGVFFLKENLTRFDLLGILFAVGGALLINYGGAAYTRTGFFLALMAAIGIALHHTAAKMFVKKINPLILVNLRVLFTSAFLLIFVLVTSSLQPVPYSALPVLIIGAGIIATTGFVFYYKALEHADISKVAVIRTLDPFMVVIYAYIAFRTLPLFQEIFGGSLIVFGVLIITLKHRIRQALSNFKSMPWFGAFAK